MSNRYDYYIAGPMRGHYDNNKQMFAWVSRTLKSRGWSSFNPADENDIDFKFSECMRKDLAVIINDCSKIIVLPGWRSSVGANAEVLVGLVCGKIIEEVILTYDDSTTLMTKDVTEELQFVLPFSNRTWSTSRVHGR